MRRLTVAACAVVGLVATVGCSAEAQSGGPSPSITLSPPIPTTTVSILPRQNVRVVLSPTTLRGGASRSVAITAYCPPAQPGTTYRATARSDAFTGIVSLLPPVATPAATAAPSLAGGAVLDSKAKPGGYRVDVRCEATNDTGSARLRITAATPATSTGYPTKAPGTGGGGTAAGRPEEGSSIPVVPLAVLLMAGAGVLLVRRRMRG